MQKGVDYKDLSVVFRDVQFHGEAIIGTEVPLRLSIMKHKGNNKFEVRIQYKYVFKDQYCEILLSNLLHIQRRFLR